ncbi:hypothetical protein APHAL10511_008165 [Amanita phalloides]|nr:hypothetical protein APHAL10511_008165 [Amanita phalloides]
MRQLITILLGIFIPVIVGVAVAYSIGTLYREYKHTKVLAARKAMDIEAQMVAAEKRSLHKVLSQINVPDPSSHPVAYFGPREKQVQAPVVSVLQVNQRARSETPIHTRLARLPVVVTRSCGDSELVTRVSVPPPIVAPTASHRRFVRSPTTITMCDRYPTFAPSYPLPLSEPEVVPSSTKNPLQATAAEGGFVMCVSVQGQKHHNGSTTVTALPIPPNTAAKKLGLDMIDMCENAGQDSSGIVTDLTPGADADVNILDADMPGSLLAYHHLF